ncbi:MAG TPA: mycothiol system anti-sigma-R factor [Acidimicrobiales bacterium]|nr:mycothiol system anti-sigma-R factor [Acidimicrobiales bacterium]
MGLSGGGPDDCNEVVVRLYHFLDGQLDDERRVLIQHHLDDCSDCLEAFDFEAELRQVVARRCRDRVPDSLRVRIFQAIQQPPGPFDGPFGGLHPR